MGEENTETPSGVCRLVVEMDMDKASTVYRWEGKVDQGRWVHILELIKLELLSNQLAQLAVNRAQATARRQAHGLVLADGTPASSLAGP
jgi:hypothetical protein